VLIRHAATDADAKGLLLGSRDEPLSGLGNVQAGKVAEFLLDMKVGCVLHCHVIVLLSDISNVLVGSRELLGMCRHAQLLTSCWT
jgi:broad specificity phosphatase PhoE